MMELVVLSGKGGTGKTSVAAALSHLASSQISIVMADADVDAANLELVLDPTRLETHDFYGGHVARINPDGCTACGICAEVCRFEAIREGDVYAVDDLSCEGCAACFHQCPSEAIQMIERQAGHWFRSQTRYGPLFHAHLFAGQENSGKLVTEVKQQARKLAEESDASLVIVDGPPGIGCPVIAACAAADGALLVVEPTVSGQHDLERILQTVHHFGVPAAVCINKADLNTRQADAIADYCTEQEVELVGRVPFDQVVTEAMVRGQPVTAYRDNGHNGRVAQAMQDMWERLAAGL
jgi:MinD superfamily P-loop ATPase